MCLSRDLHGKTNVIILHIVRITATDDQSASKKLTVAKLIKKF